MHRLCSRLIVYSDFGEDCILYRIAGINEDYELLRGEGSETLSFSEDSLILRINREIKRLLDLATEYGFDGNLWQNYLTYLLIMNENSFTLTAERQKPQQGSIHTFLENDLAIFQKLFWYDFLPLETGLGIDGFTTLTHYHAITKRERMYNRRASEWIRELSQRLAVCETTEDFVREVLNFYEKRGAGIYSVNRAFRVRIDDRDNSASIFPINNTDGVILSDLVGYESQKEKLIRNTKAFVSGRPANNCLLYGDSGTGKSTAIKAICNEFYDQGLRMIELYKHQCRYLSDVISQIKSRNYYYIIYMDDLSFEEFETEYKFLKAVIEGGVEKRPDNVLIYATSNRRHLIRENWSDRSDIEIEDGMHRSDTMQEKLSLFNRFGIAIWFGKPNKKEYNDIVLTLADNELNGKISREELLLEANRWELSHGGFSGRAARQLIDYIAGGMPE